jgi:hypothetical protein
MSPAPVDDPQPEHAIGLVLDRLDHRRDPFAAWRSMHLADPRPGSHRPVRHRGDGVRLPGRELRRVHDVREDLVGRTGDLPHEHEINHHAACSSKVLGLARSRCKLSGRQAQTRLLEALDEVSESDPEVGARLMVELASSAFHGADIDGIRDWASRALDIARTCEDRGLTVDVLSRLALA